MGINKFFTWMRKSYSSSVLPLSSSQTIYDHVYIDINVILHRIIGHSPTEDILLEKLCSYINNILKFSKPTKTLTFATDGIAPFAKLIVQRKRRLNYFRANKKCIPEINPLCFTPGTYFMNSLSVKLSDFFCDLERKLKI